MQLERRKNGERYVLEAYGPDRPSLEAQGRQWPGSYVQWEAMGIPIRGRDGQSRLSEPTFALWRPVVARAPLDELEDPAEFLGLVPAKRVATSEPQPALASQPPSSPAPETQPAPDPQPSPARRRSHERSQARLYKSVKHKNLTRVDRPSKNLYGYHVRLGWKGRVYQKWFSDTTHGDRLGALTAALAWRDEKEREIGKPRSEQTVIGVTGSNTGLVGVARVMMKGSAYYRALWRDAEGKMHRRWFSIARLGERRALRAAIKARELGVADRQH